MTIRQVRFLLLAIVTLPIALGCGDKPAATPKGDPPKDNTPPIQKADPGSAPKSDSGTPPAPKTDELLNAKPDFTLKAEETPDRLGSQADLDKFASKYGGKVLDVTGEFYQYALFAKTPEGQDCVSLRLTPGIHDFLCSGLPVPKAMPGQTIILRGRCDPKLGLGLMTLVRAEGNRPPRITAEQLAKVCKEGKADDVKVVNGKYLIVTGTILKVEQDDVSATIFLTPPGVKPEVKCFFGKKARDEALSRGWLKTGQPVQVLGEFIGSEPNLGACVVVPPEK